MAKEQDSNIVSRIVSGSTIIFAGTILHKIIAFGGSVFMARLLGSSGYGTAVIGLSIFFIGGNLLTLGLNTGIARNYSTLASDSDRRGLLVSAYQMGIGVSVIGSLLVFFQANTIAVQIFSESAVSPVLRVIAIAIPLKVLLNLSNGTIQALKLPSVKVVVTSILRPVIRILLIVAFVLGGYGAAGVAGAYLVAIGTTALVSLYVVVKRTSLLQFGEEMTPMYKSLLYFSLPLVGSTIVLKFMNNIDTLLIGYFVQSSDVGFYNVAFVLGMTTLLIIESVGFMYLPEVSELFETAQHEQAGKLYRSVTKWVTFMSTPFVLTALLYPNYILTFIYSDMYTKSTVPFIILVLGFYSNIINGPNRNTIVASGKTRHLLSIDGMAVLANIFLNILLIPQFGINGAALATGFTYTIRNTLMTTYLYRYHKFNPFTRFLLLPLFPVFVTFASIHLLVSVASIPVIIVSTALLVVVMAIGYLAEGVREEDRMIAELLYEKGVPVKILKKIHLKLR